MKARSKRNKFSVTGVAAGVALMFVVVAAGLYFLNKNKNNGAVVVVSPATPNIPSSSTTTAASDRSTAERVNPQADVSEQSGAGGSKSATGVVTPNAVLPTTFKNGIGMEFVKVPKGTAWLGGGSGQQGNMKVEMEYDFYLGKYEVTQEEWEAVTGQAPSHFSRNGPGSVAVKEVSDADLKRFPVEQVSWEDCQSFIERLNNKEKATGLVYRLPKETEWEYACRGGPGSKLDSAFDFYFSTPTSTLLPEQANFEFPKALKRTNKTGSYEPNLLGLHDMHGNVWEWCEDVEKTAEGASLRVSRGGSWRFVAASCRAAQRNSDGPARRFFGMGFRVALSPSGVSEPAVQGKGK